MMRLHKLLVIGLLAYHVLAWPATALADGGRLCASGQYGAWQVSIFGSRPLVGAGPTEFNVYVQDAASGSSVSDFEVTIEARHADTNTMVMKRASAETLPGKLVRTALCDLDSDGTWHVIATLTGQGQEPQRIDFDFEVRQLLPPWFATACWIGWPVVPIGLFSIHQRLRKERARESRRIRYTNARVRSPRCMQRLEDFMNELSQNPPQTNDALRASQERFRLIFDSLPTPCAIYDAQRRFRYVNRAMAALFRRSEEDVIGCRDEDLLPAQLTQVYLPLLCQAIESRSPRMGECSFTGPLGTMYYIALCARPR